ncbi:hypothetical protein Pla108_32480 [Botrimarina colliarenosi]|uniref:TIGR03790 family protein n=1 Tax=Botrimarina colliarenosi TaxID=2528001 RepID=A0A5C6AAT4_9BACT|nr:TIGR03790 family protein [Botrimarina colliarenosi]TWT96161.1 hypothetical protein Pla108_32480 [Botrimarina colliarenosi]
MPALRLLIGSLLTVLLLGPSLAPAALAPEEIAIIAARGNRESIGLATYYCRQRGVPEEQIIKVDVPAGESLDREKWRWAVRPEIQKWLAENDPNSKIRCLVTTWGIPLKITAGDPEKADKAYRAYLAAERTARTERLSQIASALDRLGGGAPLSDVLESIRENDAAESEEDDFAKLKAQLEAALRSSQERIAQLTGEPRRQAEAQLQQLATAAGGAAVMLQGLGQQVKAREAAGDEVPAPLLRQYELLRGRLSAFAELQLLLDGRPPSFDRDELTLRLNEQTGGLLASVEWLAKQEAVARRNERGAAFDSELSLVHWPDGYELLRWQPNYLRGAFDGSQIRTAFPTLMVARLDGPDLRTAKRLIDDAIAVEKAGGLKGKAYIDARGLTELDGPPHDPGSYPDFDRTLLATARGIEALKSEDGEPRFEVVLNEQPELFAPGQCPDAALYCGWYSLAKYVDAFDWNQGAVAYHLASAEAVTLKEIDSQAWCKKLLEDGVAATIGPVMEPYLVAFPRPNEFFALLVQGELSLVEVYYRTKPFNSWAMTLIGDPLYRPYAKK